MKATARVAYDTPRLCGPADFAFTDSRRALAGFFFASDTAPRILRNASIRYTTATGEDTSGVITSWPAILDAMISRSASV